MRSMLRALLVCSLALLVSACGRIGFDQQAEISDGGGLVSPFDSGNTDPDAFTGCEEGCVTGTASVEVRDISNTPIPDLPVVVSFPDGTISLVTTTGPTGIVDIEVVASSMVTVPLSEGLIGSTSSTSLLFTVAGVQPNDDLVIAAVLAGTASTQITVNLPGDVGNAAQYAATAGCGPTASTSTSSPKSLSYDEGCGSQAIFGVARDVAGEPLAWSSVATQSPVQDPATLPAWNTSLSTVPMTFTGSSLGGVSANLSAMVGPGTYSLQSESDVSDLTSDLFSIPTGFGTRWSSEIMVGTDSESGPGVQSLLVRVTDQLPTSVPINYDTDFLPPVSNLEFISTNTARPKLAWTNSLEAADLDMGLGIFLWDGPTSFGEWLVIFSPSSASSIQLPGLPDSMASMRPSAEADFESVLYLVETDFVDGYDEVRANPTLQTLFSGVGPFEPPATGSYEIRASFTAVFGNL